MNTWTIPGLYLLVYLDKRVQGLNLIRHFDLSRPFVICPEPRGSKWQYLRRRLNQLDALAIRQILLSSLDNVQKDDCTYCVSIDKPQTKQRFNEVSLIEAMFTHAFLSEKSEIVGEALKSACEQLQKIGYDSTTFFHEIIRVDYGMGGMQEYCLFGGPNRLVNNVLMKNVVRNSSFNSLLESMSKSMDDEWHAKMACFLGVILWSKVKVSPLLREGLIDDTIHLYPKSMQNSIKRSFTKIVAQAMTAYARNPI